MLTTAEVIQIANAWASAEHYPDHLSYKAFVAETREMFRTIAIQITPYDSGSPYLDINSLFADLEENHHLFVYTGGSPLEKDHPLAGETEYGFNLNVMFRAVHDICGHYSTRCDFSLNGEIAAYLNHKAMYSAEALPAVFGETVGQLCYYYAFGGFVPSQKCAIIPVVI